MISSVERRSCDNGTKDSRDNSSALRCCRGAFRATATPCTRATNKSVGSPAAPCPPAWASRSAWAMSGRSTRRPERSSPWKFAAVTFPFKSWTVASCKGKQTRRRQQHMYPADLRYNTDHEWARQEGNKVRVGITHYAQDELGDVVFVD